MTGLNRISAIDVVNATVTADAGVSIHQLMHHCVPLGLFVPVTPGTRYVTVGGAIAADIHGKNHHVDGTFGNHLMRFKLLTASGEILVVDRESHPDIFDATVGGMGMTGIILSATIKMIPISSSTILVDTNRTENLNQLLTLMIEGDRTHRYSVAWVDTLARGRSLGRGVLYRGNHDEQNAAGQLTTPEHPTLRIPDIVPGSFVGRLSARAFNSFWFRRHPQRERERPQSLSAFFHQLDLIGSTNRIYGRDGFIQHQSVIPDRELPSLTRIIEMLSDQQVPTYLVVLKRMGPGSNLLSFPLYGWTLAIDIPARWPDLHLLLDELDRIVLEAGGRAYLAKDSRMKPETFAQMYPDLNRWRSIVDSIDPERTIVSDLGRRLDIRGVEGTS